MTLGIIVVFSAYAVASYGIVLMRGYDIPWRAWVNPVHPWSWPPGAVPRIPAAQFLPG